jgi:hypothetical protein
MTIDYNGRNIWGPSDGVPVTTYNIDYDRRDIDISSEISYLLPEATPFLTILMRASKVKTGSVEFVWYDKDAPSWWTKIDSSYIDSATTIEVTDASFLNPKDIIKNTVTGEVMFVSAVDTSVSPNELTVIREYGYDSVASTGTQAAASNGEDDNIMKLGNAMEENSLSPDGHATQPSKNFNYVQTFRTPFDSSADNQAEGKEVGPDTRARLRKEQLIEHRIDIERQLMFGERNEVIDADNKIRRMTGGVTQFINSNSYDIATENDGILTEQEWENFCEMGLNWGSKRKLFLTSPRVGSIINQFASGRIETTSGDDMYGMRLARYISFHGDVVIATTKLFENEYQSTGLMLDIGNISFRPFDGKDSTLKANIQENDRDGWKDEYMTKAGLQVELDKTHAILTGIQR